jgi:hypothetical protein
MTPGQGGGARVVNRRREKETVYIGRGSKWGNPYAPDFMRGRCAAGTKYLPPDEVLPAYEDYVRASPELMAALPELRGQVLGCYCKPKPCHGDVLVKLLEEVEP